MRFESKHYSINDFREWDDRKELELTPKFQRRSVWSDKARSYLMDTVIRGYPISKVFMRHDVDPKTKKSLREIVDGQQRIRTILNYLQDGFKISKIHNKEHGGKYYSQLPDPLQRHILHFEVSVDVLLGANDTEILNTFARLNTYTVKLSAQELRNAKWFGIFKQTVYALGYEYMNFWLSNKILSERDVARMIEAELASELVIYLIDGIQDRKKIDDYYRQYDEAFKNRKNIINNFRRTMDSISEIMQDNLPDSYFSTKPLFYSLFGVTNDLQVNQKIHRKNYPKILSALQNLDHILDSDPDDLSPLEFKFYDAYATHVTDLSRRKIRHAYIKKAILKTIK